MTQDSQPKNGQRGSPLGLARRGFSGRIRTVEVGAGPHGLTAAELERRLLDRHDGERRIETPAADCAVSRGSD